jgi:Peptidase family M49
MRKPARPAGTLALLATTLLAASLQAAAPAKVPDAAELARMAARFSPTEIRVDLSALSPGDRKALPKLLQAAQVVNDIYLQQVWSKNVALYASLKKDKTPLGRERLNSFWINKGPWSLLDEETAFLPGVPEKKPAGAAFYPEGATKEQLENWMKGLSEPERQKAQGFFTVIERLPDSGFKSVPFSKVYRADLERAARLLHEAAALTENATLKSFLTTRAAAFLSDEYTESDIAWMDLDAPLDITIGPYETYNDGVFGYKASFEAYVNLRDDKETARLGAFGKHLQEIENALPIPPEWRNPKIGALAPIRVVNEVFASGDGDHGVQTAAYNLPNDEKVTAQKGTKRVMLKNIQEAKFKKILLPIAAKALTTEAQTQTSFDSFFTHILAHELTHGLGPHQIKVDGRDTTPRHELKELYSAIEEAKADVTGLFAMQFLMDLPGTDVVPKGPEAEGRLYTTFLASTFRTLRFGTGDAHARGMAVQMNFLLDKGAFRVNGDGTFSVDFAKIKDAVKDLDRELLTIEAKGDYAAAKKLLDTLGEIRPSVKKVFDSVITVPIDIQPLFVTAHSVTPEL